MLRICSVILGFIFLVIVTGVDAAALEKDSLLVQNKSGNTVFSISALTGYQHIDLHFIAPFAQGPGGVELLHPSPLNLELHDGDLWIGGLGADIKKGRISGFVKLMTNRQRDTTVTTTSEPFWGGDNPVKWSGNDLKWWAINAGAGFDITKHFTIQAGLRMERLSFGIFDAFDSQRLIPLFRNFFGDDYRGELDSKLLIPWVGVRGQINRFSGSVRFSPLAHTEVQIPFTYRTVLSSTVTTVEQENYSFSHNGVWLEGSLAYDILKRPSWSCTLWAEASWLWAYGGVQNTYTATWIQTGTPVTTVLSSISTVDGQYYTGNYGIGLRINYDF